MGAVEGATRDRGVDAHQRFHRCHEPVRAEGQHRAGVEQRAERIGTFRPSGADPLLGPAAVVDGVVGLHRGDDVLAVEARDVLGTQVLGVLDAQAPVARAVAAHDFGEHVQHRSEEHTSELQSLMRTSYAVFCLKKKTRRMTVYTFIHIPYSIVTGRRWISSTHTIVTRSTAP